MISRYEEKNNWLLNMILFVIPIISILSTGYLAFFGTREKKRWGQVSLCISVIIHIIIFVFIIRFMNMSYEDLYTIINKIK